METTENLLKLLDRKREVEDSFVLIEPSKLSLCDELMKYVPNNPKEVMFREELRKALFNNIRNFYAPRFNPSINWSYGGIRFTSGYRPSVGKSYKWWLEKSIIYAPDNESRLGTKSEYMLFLGYLIKNLVSKGVSVEKAWNAVCVDSKELGHYKNSDDAKDDFELTGSREVCGFF